MDFNKLSKTPYWEVENYSLEILNLNSCNLRRFPENIKGLKRICKLVLRDNYLQSIPKWVSGLESLKTLDLSKNSLSKFPDIRGLNFLESINLSDNKIKSIPSWIKGLTYLKQFGINNNQLLSLPKELKLLGNLTRLEVGKNNISQLAQIIPYLKQLENIDISETGISDLEIFQNFSNINRLELSGNKIQDLRPILHLIERRSLVLNSDKKAWFGEINVIDNPLSTPPVEIIAMGDDAVRKYFRDLELQGVDYLYEAKLLIVGEGDSGKTSLAWKLKDIDSELPKKGEDRTEGIDVQSIYIDNRNLPENPFRMNVWDFGGQEIYHSTHQFFLTKRSLYIIVNNTRSNLTDFNHWLQMISLYSENSPVIIVQNEVSGSIAEIDKRGLQQHFSNILFVLETDLSNKDDRLKKLVDYIHFHIQNLSHIGSELPKSWVAIRNILNNLAKKEPIINDSEFVKICKKHSVNTKDEIKRVSSVFHDLGVFLHFQNDPILKRIVILQNSWATKGVYKILDNPKIIKQKGRFSYEELEATIEKTLFEGKQDELLELMKRFELCYRIPNQKLKNYVCPQLLPIEKPEYQWNDEKNLIIYYDYDFKPKGLIGRLIVRLYKYVKDIEKFAWKNGCVFEYENSQAQVVETYGSSKIEIRIRGPRSTNFSSIIIKEIDELNSTFNQLRYEKMIPCNCGTCKQGKQPHFYNYKNLLKRYEKGKKTVECAESYEDVIVQEILNGIYEFSTSEKTTISKLVEKNKLEEAIALLQLSSPREAILLSRLYNQGRQFFLLGMSTLEDWSVYQQSIGFRLLELEKIPLSLEGGSYNFAEKIKVIEDGLEKNEKLLIKIINTNVQNQKELFTLVEQIEKETPTKEYVEEIVNTIKRGMTDFEQKIPNEKDIIEAWKTISSDLKLNADSKAKLKFTLPFLFLKLEKEYSWNGTDWFKSIRQDIANGVKGNWSDMFLEKKI
jgi:Leucine-rich repeat (LRR) protein